MMINNGKDCWRRDMSLRLFFIIFIFFILVSNSYGKRNINESYIEIKKQVDLVKKLSFEGKDEKFLLEYKKLIKESNKAETTVKHRIINSIDNQEELSEAIFIAGLLKLKGLKDIIQRVQSTDLITNLNIYYFFYNIDYKKKLYFKYLTYFADKMKNEKIYPFVISVGAYHTYELMGWVFDKNILTYLESHSHEKFDGGLGETFSCSIKRVKLVLSLYE